MPKAHSLRNRRHKKAPDVGHQGLFCVGLSGFRLDFVSLHAFLALHCNECHFLAFFQALETVALDRAEMDEQIRTAFWRDKTKTFFIVKPLNGTALTCRHFLIPKSIKLMTVSFTRKSTGLVAGRRNVERVVALLLALLPGSRSQRPMQTQSRNSTLTCEEKTSPVRARIHGG